MTDRILVLDVDGTLVARGRGVDLELRQTLVRLADLGWSIVLATGRRLHQLQDILAELPVAAVLSSEGATITLDGVTVYEARLQPYQWRRVAGLANSLGLTPVICTETAAYAEVDNDDIRYAATFADPSPTFGRLDDIGDVAASLAMLVTAGLGATPAAAEAVTNTCSVQATVSAPGFVSVTPQGTDKGSALARLLRDQGREAMVVAAGDSLNDLSLLRAAAHRIVMPTAPTELLAIAHAVADPIDKGGLVQSLLAICKQGPRSCFDR